MNFAHPNQIFETVLFRTVLGGWVTLFPTPLVKISPLLWSQSTLKTFLEGLVVKWKMFVRFNCRVSKSEPVLKNWIHTSLTPPVSFQCHEPMLMTRLDASSWKKVFPRTPSSNLDTSKNLEPKSRVTFLKSCFSGQSILHIFRETLFIVCHFSFLFFFLLFLTHNTW